MGEERPVLLQPEPPPQTAQDPECSAETTPSVAPTPSPPQPPPSPVCQQTRPPQTQEEAVEWPPPYQPNALDLVDMQVGEDFMDLPDLPPPPFFYCEQAQPPPPSASHLVPKPPPQKAKPPRAAAVSSSPRLRPPTPSKFPVSLYVPPTPGDRRPSDTSQYDNLSDDGQSAERPLAPTPEESPSMHCTSAHSVDRAYDPTRHPLPPPPALLPRSLSPLPPATHPLPALPREPEDRGGSWVQDAVPPPPPPSFADRLSQFQQRGAPTCPKPLCRGPRDRSAFPAPLMYTGSPRGHSRSPGQPSVLLQSSPDFCSGPPGGQQLTKSVTS